MGPHPCRGKASSGPCHTLLVVLMPPHPAGAPDACRRCCTQVSRARYCECDNNGALPAAGSDPRVTCCSGVLGWNGDNSRCGCVKPGGIVPKDRVTNSW